MGDIRSKMFIGLYVNYPILLSDFNETWVFATLFRKIMKYQTLWKPFQWQPSFTLRTNG